MSIVLVILAILSIFGGFIKLPMAFKESAGRMKDVLEIIAGVTSVAGVFFAYLLFAGRRRFVSFLLNSRFCEALREFWFADWGFDWLYRTILVRPYKWLAFINSDDFLDRIYDGISALCQIFNRALAVSITGNVRWYVGGLVIGSIIIIGFVILI